VAGLFGGGAVVGATNPEQLAVLRGMLPQTLFLCRGMGRRAGARRTWPRRSRRTDGGDHQLVAGDYFRAQVSEVCGAELEKAVEAAVVAAKAEIGAALGDDSAAALPDYLMGAT